MFLVGILLTSSPVYAQDSATKPPSLNGHWVTPNSDFESGKPEDRGALGLAKVWSDENSAVGIAIYVSESVPKEKAEGYGEGLMRMFKKKNIPANYFIQRLGQDDGSGKGAMDFFVHGYFIGTYSGKDLPAGILLAIDLFNGEAYAVQMLEDGEL